MSDQSDVDELASEIITICSGRNSSVCVLAMLSVIENIVFSGLASDDFKRQTSMLLTEESNRITSSMQKAGKEIN